MYLKPNAPTLPYSSTPVRSLMMLFLRCRALHVGDGSVQPEGALDAPLQDFHRSNPSHVVRVLGSDALRFAEARRDHDIDSVGPIGRRAGKKQSPRSMLIVQPLPVFFVMELFAFLFFRQ